MNGNTAGRTLLHAASLSAKIWLRGGTLLAVFVFCYFDPLSLMVRTWLDRDGYSYGFLVPAISAYFAYADRRKLRALPVRPNIAGGLTLVLISGLLLVIGRAGIISTVQQIALFVVIPGVALALLGTRYTKALALPLSYLVLMFPMILDTILDRMHWPLQLFTATSAGMLLKLFHIPVFQSAQYLELPGITLEVANACSGVRYLVSIIALGIPLAYFTQKTWVRRITLIVFAVAIGILANPVRVALIGIWTYYTGRDAHGPLHIFQGFFVSVVGFVFLLAGAWVLARNPVPAGDRPQSEEMTSPGAPVQLGRAWIALMLAFVALGGFLYIYNPMPVPLKAPLSAIPLEFGDWQGGEAVHYPSPLKIHGADCEIDRIYRNGSGREIRLQIGYFESQRQEKRLVQPEVQELYRDSTAFELPLDARAPVTVNRTIIRNGPKLTLVLYWHDLGGRITADKLKVKLFTAVDSLFHRRTNGATVLISTDITGMDELQAASDDTSGFTRRFLPVLTNYVPTH